MLSKNCQSCGNVFYKKINESKKYWEKKVVCSIKCANSFKKGKNFPNNGQFRKGITSWNKGIKPSKKTRLKISLSCKGRLPNSGSFKKGHVTKRAYLKGKDNPAWKSIEKTCIVCQKKYLVQKYRTEKSRFCSPQCWHKFARGKNSPVWTDNYKKRFKQRIMELPEYKNWRFKVFERDGFKCECGNKDIEAHHINPCFKILERNNITTIEDAIKCQELWEVSNGKTLCRKCHRKTDSYGKQKDYI